MGFSLGRSLGKVWRAYEGQLHRRPVLTQMTTSALLWGLGDVIAQRVAEQRAGADIDTRRALLTAGFGAGFMGPIGHNWYLALDAVCGRFLRPGGKAFLAAKVLTDQFVFGPIYVIAFYAYGCALIDRSGLAGLEKKIRQDFIPTYMAELAIWPLFQVWNFTKVPIRHQLLAINCVTLLDATFLSWTMSQDDWFGKLTASLQGRQAAAAAAAGAAAESSAAAAAAPSDSSRKTA